MRILEISTKPRIFLEKIMQPIQSLFTTNFPEYSQATAGPRRPTYDILVLSAQTINLTRGKAKNLLLISATREKSEGPESQQKKPVRQARV